MALTFVDEVVGGRWTTTKANAVYDGIEKLSTGRGFFLVAASDSPATVQAVADYVCDGTADEVQINQALSDLGAGGGRVILSVGTFTIAAPITIPSYCWLQGQGYGSKILLRANHGSGINMVTGTDQSSGNSYITVSDLRIDGNNSNGNNATADQRGIVMTKWSRSIVRNCWIEHLGGSGVASCIAINPVGGNGNIIDGNIMEDVVDGINTSGTETRTRIVNNVINSTNRDYGLNLFQLSDCYVAGNVVRECQKEGIKISTMNRCIVIGNHVRDCGRETDNTYGAIGFASGQTSADNVIAYNVVRRASSGNQQSYALTLHSAALGTMNRIEHNDFETGGKTGDIQNNAYTLGEVMIASFKDNIGNAGTPLDGVIVTTSADTIECSPQLNACTFYATKSSATQVFSLPPTRVGLRYTFVCGNASGEINISPNAADKITGLSIAGADDGDIKNTAASNAVGDAITLEADGADGWIVTNKLGTWATV